MNKTLAAGLAIAILNTAAHAAPTICEGAPLNLESSGDAAAQEIMRLEQVASSTDLPEIDFKIGRMYELHRELDPDYSAAVAWYRKSAGLGCGAANSRLAVLSETGSGIAKDQAESNRLIRIAAEMGHVPSETLLGVKLISESDDGEKVNEGLMWIRRAVQAGDSTAMLFLAQLEIEGLKIPSDYQDAQKLLKSVYWKKDANYPAAAYSLGLMFSEGKGVPIDKVEALKWMTVAAYWKLGDSPARLQTLEKEIQADHSKRQLIETCHVFKDISLAGEQYFTANVGDFAIPIGQTENVTTALFPQYSTWGFLSNTCLAR